MDLIEPKIKLIIDNEYYILFLLLSIFFMFHIGFPSLFEILLTPKVDLKKNEKKDYFLWNIFSLITNNLLVGGKTKVWKK